MPFPYQYCSSRLAGDFRAPTSRLAGDQKVSCQPAGRRHFLIFIIINPPYPADCESRHAFANCIDSDYPAFEDGRMVIDILRFYVLFNTISIGTVI